jgi:hypothetical protein
MIVNAERLLAKREMWDHVAIEFGYSCACCNRRPMLDDSEAYLLTGYCRSCWSEVSGQNSTPGRVPSHL